jgi:hypothetical protein
MERGQSREAGSRASTRGKLEKTVPTDCARLVTFARYGPRPQQAKSGQHSPATADLGCSFGM